MLHNLAVFYATQGEIYHGTMAWPESPELWPSYLTLGTAGLSALLASAVMVGYICGTKVANTVNTTRTVISIVISVTTFVLWSGVVGSLSSTKGSEKSLWGASCWVSEDKEDLWEKKINFYQFCLEQVSPWSSWVM
jgi:hypothetical protein